MVSPRQIVSVECGVAVGHRWQHTRPRPSRRSAQPEVADRFHRRHGRFDPLAHLRQLRTTEGWHDTVTTDLFARRAVGSSTKPETDSSSVIAAPCLRSGGAAGLRTAAPCDSRLSIHQRTVAAPSDRPRNRLHTQPGGPLSCSSCRRPKLAGRAAQSATRTRRRKDLRWVRASPVADLYGDPGWIRTIDLPLRSESGHSENIG